MAIMAENNVAVAHNPQSNLKLASGIAPVPEMIGKGYYCWSRYRWFRI